MCLSVYLASQVALPVVEWTMERPAFNAGPLEPFEASVRTQMSLPFVTSLGSHTQCGCGFLRDGEESVEAVRSSRGALVEYASRALRTGPVELYVCWNGDAEDVYSQELSLGASDLLEDDAWLVEGTLVRLRAETA